MNLEYDLKSVVIVYEIKYMQRRQALSVYSLFNAFLCRLPRYSADTNSIHDIFFFADDCLKNCFISSVRKTQLTFFTRHRFRFGIDDV